MEDPSPIRHASEVLREAEPADPFRAIIERRAVEGCNTTTDGVRFHRISHPRSFRKTHALGPTLTVVAQGRKVARLGPREVHYDPSLCFVITGETVYDAEVLEAAPDRPYLAASIDIPVDLVVKTLLALPEAEPAGPRDQGARDGDGAVFVTRFDDAMKETVTRLFRANEDAVERRIVAPLALEELTFRLLRSEAADVVRRAIHARDAQAIHQAMRYIRAHSTRALSVDDVARHVAMSSSHFAHRFRAVAGVSPMRYLKNVRLGEARSAILGGGLRVHEVAARVGYESVSHFTRDFKAAFGAAPAEYARRARAV